jgi:hypothetical protein
MLISARTVDRDLARKLSTTKTGGKIAQPEERPA